MRLRSRSCGKVLGSESSQSVSDRVRRLELATSESPQQRVQLVAQTTRWQDDLVLDGARLPVSDTNALDVLLQQPDHSRIVCSDQCREVADPFLTSPINQSAQQRGSEPSALPLIDDGDGDICPLRVFDVPDVSSDAKAAAIDRIYGAKGLMVVVIDLGEVTQLRGGQGWFAGQESQTARLGAQACEAVCQQRGVP